MAPCPGSRRRRCSGNPDRQGRSCRTPSIRVRSSIALSIASVVVPTPPVAAMKVRIWPLPPGVSDVALKHPHTGVQHLLRIDRLAQEIGHANLKEPARQRVVESFGENDHRREGRPGGQSPGGRRNSRGAWNRGRRRSPRPSRVSGRLAESSMDSAITVADMAQPGQAPPRCCEEVAIGADEGNRREFGR